MGKKILIIDDEELLTRTYTLLLEKSGFETYTALNGDDAKAMAEEEDFGLIISDIRLPGKDGIKVVKEIQDACNAKSGKRRIPVIFVTGYCDKEIKKFAAKLEPIAFLTKPFDNAELLNFTKGIFSK